jgi:hypothetical protein
MRNRSAIDFILTTTLCTVVSLATVSPAAGQEIVVQNDSVMDLGTAAVQAGFAENERAAAWLTTPCAGQVTKVQVAWQSFTGGTPAVLGDSITVYEAGTFPIPGDQLAVISGPLMNDGYFNEFELPLPVSVAEDQTFVVSFQFFESPPPTNGPSVVTDVDGCQAGKNGIFAIPPSVWFNACSLGISGDLAIRAVVDCTNPLIFSDGFESGDVSAWSENVP